MILNLCIEIPDDSTLEFIAKCLREQADNAAGQLEYKIIPMLDVDDAVILRDSADGEDVYTAEINRSE